MDHGSNVRHIQLHKEQIGCGEQKEVSTACSHPVSRMGVELQGCRVCCRAGPAPASTCRTAGFQPPDDPSCMENGEEEI